MQRTMVKPTAEPKPTIGKTKQTGQSIKVAPIYFEFIHEDALKLSLMRMMLPSQRPKLTCY